jgi:hypothetical protein
MVILEALVMISPLLICTCYLAYGVIRDIKKYSGKKEENDDRRCDGIC